MIVEANQTLFDIAINNTGTYESVFAIALANGLPVSALLSIGQEIIIPDDVATDTDVLGFMQGNNSEGLTYNVATALPAPSGLGGDLIIEETFKIG